MGALLCAESRVNKRKEAKAPSCKAPVGAKAARSGKVWSPGLLNNSVRPHYTRPAPRRAWGVRVAFVTDRYEGGVCDD